MYPNCCLCFNWLSRTKRFLPLHIQQKKKPSYPLNVHNKDGIFCISLILTRVKAHAYTTGSRGPKKTLGTWRLRLDQSHHSRIPCLKCVCLPAVVKIPGGIMRAYCLFFVTCMQTKLSLESFALGVFMRVSKLPFNRRGRASNWKQVKQLPSLSFFNLFLYFSCQSFACSSQNACSA